MTYATREEINAVRQHINEQIPGAKEQPSYTDFHDLRFNLSPRPSFTFKHNNYNAVISFHDHHAFTDEETGEQCEPYTTVTVSLFTIINNTEYVSNIDTGISTFPQVPTTHLLENAQHYLEEKVVPSDTRRTN